MIWRTQVCVGQWQRWKWSSNRRDCSAIPSRVPLGGVLRQPCISRTRRLPA